CISASFTFSQTPDLQRGTIVVKVIAFRKASGDLHLSLYNKPTGFPRDLSKRIGFKKPRITNKSVMEVRFEDLPFGTYAIAGLHDENSSGEMDYNFIGIPKEGYCFSNDARPVLSAPSYDSAKFKLDRKEKVVYIAMQY
ncbi:MAG: DUF2141 domain-containing protein, partial [Bacteroidota bacterium]